MKCSKFFIKSCSRYFSRTLQKAHNYKTILTYLACVRLDEFVDSVSATWCAAVFCFCALVGKTISKVSQVHFDSETKLILCHCLPQPPRSSVRFGSVRSSQAIAFVCERRWLRTTVRWTVENGNLINNTSEIFEEFRSHSQHVGWISTTLLCYVHNLRSFLCTVNIRFETTIRIWIRKNDEFWKYGRPGWRWKAYWQ